MIYCCGCQKDVNARLTNGAEIYPHRPDLKDVPMWKCDTCKNYVGCHHKTSKPTRPLGNIPTEALRNARKEIHKIVDPIWEKKGISRRKIYAHASIILGYPYHTAEIKTLEEARRAYKIFKEFSRTV